MIVYEHLVPCILVFPVHGHVHVSFIFFNACVHDVPVSTYNEIAGGDSM